MENDREQMEDGVPKKAPLMVNNYLGRLLTRYGLNHSHTNMSEASKEHFNPSNLKYWVFVLIFGFFYFHHLLKDEKDLLGPEMARVSADVKRVVAAPSVPEKAHSLIANATDFSQLSEFSELFVLFPALLDSIPSSMPLMREQTVLSSPFGMRNHPIYKVARLHAGTDFASPMGTVVYAPAAGKVVKIERSEKGHGLHIVLLHGYSITSLYGHLSEVLVSLGDSIKPHQAIGLVGSSGLSTGPHLHYELAKSGKKVDPFPTYNLKYSIYKKISNTKH